VLLVGIRIPPNYGRDYSERFAAVFGQLAREQKVAVVPFLLDGFADDLRYFQDDRIHPNESAQPRMLDTVWPQLAPLLRPSKR
jgi:acyl-CoA thioesterase-1